MGNKREIQEINASSMADIAFLLLIFFLVATTMNVDTGITRMLPPIPPEDTQVQNLKEKERNLLYVNVTKFNTVLVTGAVQVGNVDITQLKDIVKAFILNTEGNENLPEKTLTDIELPDGGTWAYPVSEGIVSLRNDNETTYDLYIQVQNELTRAFNEMRNDVARQRYGRDMSTLSTEETKVITEAVPQQISEQEPVTTGGGN